MIDFLLWAPVFPSSVAIWFPDSISYLWKLCDDDNNDNEYGYDLDNDDDDDGIDDDDDDVDYKGNSCSAGIDPSPINPTNWQSAMQRVPSRCDDDDDDNDDDYDDNDYFDDYVDNDYFDRTCLYLCLCFMKKWPPQIQGI